jgi:hypothetical protein
MMHTWRQKSGYLKAGSWTLAKGSSRSSSQMGLSLKSVHNAVQRGPGVMASVRLAMATYNAGYAGPAGLGSAVAAKAEYSAQ